MRLKLKIAAVLAALVLVPLSSGRSVEGADLRIMTEVVSQERAWSEYWSLWGLFRSGLDRGDVSGARRDLHAALESKRDGGIGDLPAFSVALIHLAAAKPQESEWLLEYASKLSPGSAMVELSLSRYHLGGGTVHFGRALEHFTSAANKAANDVPFRLRLTGLALIFPLAFALLFGLALSGLAMARHGLTYWHDFSDFFSATTVPRWARAGLALLALLVPAAAGLSVWWLIAWWLLVFSIYMKPGEIAPALAWFCLVLPAPMLVEKYSRLAAAEARDDFRAMVRAHNGLSLAGDLEALSRACPAGPDPGKPPAACFSRARLLGRQGLLEEALAVYDQLLDDPGVEQESALNRAELLFFMPEPEGKTLAGTLARVEDAVKQAEARGPERMEVLYNWGRFYQFSDSTKMTDSLARARELGPRRMAELDEVYFEETEHEEAPGRGATIKTYRLNRLFASVRLPAGLLFEEASRETEISRAVSAGLWSRWMGPLAGFEFWIGWAGAGAAMVLLAVVGGRWRPSYRCSSCGDPICSRCEPAGKDPSICSPCYYVFRDTASMVDLQVKMQKRAEAQRYKDRRDRIGLALSLLLPGSGLLFRGFQASGTVILALALAILAGPSADLAAWPQTQPSFERGISIIHAVLGPAWIILMICSLLIYRSRTE